MKNSEVYVDDIQDEGTFFSDHGAFTKLTK
jgi:hypothetical protein